MFDDITAELPLDEATALAAICEFAPLPTRPNEQMGDPDTLRGIYLSYWSTTAEAIAFEDACLVEDTIPQCALDVIETGADTAEYWIWLLAQLATKGAIGDIAKRGE